MKKKLNSRTAVLVHYRKETVLVQNSRSSLRASETSSQENTIPKSIFVKDLHELCFLLLKYVHSDKHGILQV